MQVNLTCRALDAWTRTACDAGGVTSDSLLMSCGVGALQSCLASVKAVPSAELAILQDNLRPWLDLALTDFSRCKIQCSAFRAFGRLCVVLGSTCGHTARQHRRQALLASAAAAVVEVPPDRPLHLSPIQVLNQAEWGSVPHSIIPSGVPASRTATGNASVILPNQAPSQKPPHQKETSCHGGAGGTDTLQTLPPTHPSQITRCHLLAL